MGFSKEWEEAYKNNTQMSVWPWSDLVSYIYRYTDIKKRRLRVLELGCGAGANIRLFDELGADYYGIDGSATIVEMLHSKFPGDKYPSINLAIGDFTKDIPFEGSFDIIFDRGALTHNTTESIKSVSKMIARKLKADGLFIGIDWFSTNHDDYKWGGAIRQRCIYEIYGREC